MPYFWSDLADWSSMEYIGPATDWDAVWFRGSPDDGKFTAWYMKDGKVAGALTVGRSEDLSTASELLKSGTDIADKRSEIEDTDSDLAALASGSSSG